MVKYLSVSYKTIETFQIKYLAFKENKCYAKLNKSTFDGNYEEQNLLHVLDSNIKDIVVFIRKTKTFLQQYLRKLWGNLPRNFINSAISEVYFIVIFVQINCNLWQLQRALEKFQQCLNRHIETFKAFSIKPPIDYIAF